MAEPSSIDEKVTSTDAEKLKLEGEEEIPESMRRLKEMISAGILAVGDSIRFDYKSISFTSVLAEDGSLRNAQELPSSDATDSTAAALEGPLEGADPQIPPQQSEDPPVKDEEAVFSSPTAFATAMAKRALSRRNPRQRPRGKLSINGWDGCTVNGKTLKDLRGTMLRELKNATTSVGEGVIISDKQQVQGDSEKVIDRQAASANETNDINDTVMEEKESEIIPTDQSQDKGITNTKPEDSDPSVQRSEQSPKPNVDSTADTPNSAIDDPPIVEGAPDKSDKSASSSEDDLEDKPEANQESSNDSDTEMGRKAKAKTSAESSKKKKRNSTPKPVATPTVETRKRKRSGSNTPPSQSNSTSGSVERAARARRRLNMGGAVDTSQDGLDPDTVEAVAVAAAAEKEEAIAARRKTRLASGKIKQVDYKASVNVLPSKPLDDNDNEESDVDFPDTSAEHARASRRRQGIERDKRASKRVAKLRAGKGKESSPPPDSAEREEGRQAKLTSSAQRAGSSGTSRNGEVEGGKGSGESDGMPKRAGSVGKNDVGAQGQGNTWGDSGSPDSISNEDEEDGEFSRLSAEDRRDENGWSIAGLSMVATVVRNLSSTVPSDVLKELRRDKSWSSMGISDQALTERLQKISEDILNISGRTPPAGEDHVRVNEMLAYFATEVWRIQIGHERPALSAARRFEKIEKRKAQLEKRKRRHKRELDDTRHQLEAILEQRRKADLELALVQVRIDETKRRLERDCEKREKYENALKDVRLQERHTRERVERTKQLFSNLSERGHMSSAERHNNPESPTALGKRNRQDNDAVGNEQQDSGATVGESITSSSLSDHQSNLQEALSPRSVARRQELQRLRNLVVLRGAEAEEWQRVCEREHALATAALETKARLDHELYMNPLSSPHRSEQHAGSSAKHANGTARAKASSSKSQFGRPSSSAQASRVVNSSAGFTRTKGTGKNGANGNGDNAGKTVKRKVAANTLR